MRIAAISRDHWLRYGSCCSLGIRGRSVFAPVGSTHARAHRRRPRRAHAMIAPAAHFLRSPFQSRPIVPRSVAARAPAVAGWMTTGRRGPLSCFDSGMAPKAEACRQQAIYEVKPPAADARQRKAAEVSGTSTAQDGCPHRDTGWAPSQRKLLHRG